MAEDEKKLNQWKDMWETGNTPFSLPDRHGWLVKDSNIDVLLRKRTNQKIFIPLCGDSVDMKWFGDLGNTVVGVDIGKEAFEHFFTKYNIPYTVEPADSCKGTLYKSNDGVYKLYCCDFFEFNSNVEGKFDAVLDSAALVAVHYDVRKRYVEILADVMKEDSVCILEGVVFEKKSWEGAPYGITKEETMTLFEPRFNVKDYGHYVFTIPGGGSLPDHKGEGHEHQGQGHEHQGQGHDEECEDDVLPCDIYLITLKSNS